jgi:hypothetical protein
VRVLPFVRVLQWGSVQVLPDGLLDHPAGVDGKVMAFA